MSVIGWFVAEDMGNIMQKLTTDCPRIMKFYF